jgi:hypothetical protein
MSMYLTYAETSDLQTTKPQTTLLAHYA